MYFEEKNELKKNQLTDFYEVACKRASDINEHLPVIQALATKCASATEIGVRGMVSTWAILDGLAKSSAADRRYLGIDLQLPPIDMLNFAIMLARENKILFHICKENDMNIEIPQTDFLFIDSLHTYCHLTYELKKFSSKASKYIALHDTSGNFEFCDDFEYSGDYSEYPVEIDRKKRGLWPAVEDFLKFNQDWVISERRLNNNGLTVLERRV